MTTATTVKSKAGKKPTKTIKPTKQTAKKVEKTQESPWYVFCSTGCGFCKKAEPIIEELQKEGHDILFLDMAEPDNQQLNRELQTEYGKKCGTPWFINAETGKGICGFREKDIIEKWLDGEDIPEPPRVNGRLPKLPLMGATNKEEIAWKKEYKKFIEDNQHMPDDWKKQLKSADVLLKNPRAKSDPPLYPTNFATITDVEIEEWSKITVKWQEENSHLKNLPPIDKLVEQIKNRRKQLQVQSGQAANGAPSVDNPKINALDAKVQALEVKIDKIMNHFGVK